MEDPDDDELPLTGASILKILSSECCKLHRENLLDTQADSVTSLLTSYI